MSGRLPCTLSTEGIDGAQPRNRIPSRGRVSGSLNTLDIRGAQPFTTVEASAFRFHPPPPAEIEGSKAVKAMGKYPGLWDRKPTSITEFDDAKAKKSLETRRCVNPLTPDYQIKPIPPEKMAPLEPPKFIRDSLSLDDMPDSRASITWKYKNYTMQQRDLLEVRDIVGDMTGAIHRGTKHVPQWARFSGEPTLGQAVVRDPLFLGDIAGSCSRPSAGTKHTPEGRLEQISMQQHMKRDVIVDLLATSQAEKAAALSRAHGLPISPRVQARLDASARKQRALYPADVSGSKNGGGGGGGGGGKGSLYLTTIGTVRAGTAANMLRTTAPRRQPPAIAPQLMAAFTAPSKTLYSVGIQSETNENGGGNGNNYDREPLVYTPTFNYQQPPRGAVLTTDTLPPYAAHQSIPTTAPAGANRRYSSEGGGGGVARSELATSLATAANTINNSTYFYPPSTAPAKMQEGSPKSSHTTSATTWFDSTTPMPTHTVGGGGGGATANYNISNFTKSSRVVVPGVVTTFAPRPQTVSYSPSSYRGERTGVVLSTGEARVPNLELSATKPQQRPVTAIPTA